MRRTNIYLADDQCITLDELARSAGVSRAELIRRMIDGAIALESPDLAGDLAAIEESFGALTQDGVTFDRRSDARMRHLDDIANA